MNFKIEQEVSDLGVRVAIIVIRNMTNCKENEEFNEYKNKIYTEICNNLTEDVIKGEPILKGFWELHEKVGKTSKHDVSSPENLLFMLLKNGTLPNINLIVDIYNLVSIKTHLALGAHDLNSIVGDVTLKLTNGDENFLPIGYSKPKSIGRGEYAYIDGGNDVLCRMEVRQVEKTKVLESTKNCMYIVQGNEYVDDITMKKAVDMLIELTLKYCGGEAEVLFRQY